jgi:glucosamine kinase
MMYLIAESGATKTIWVLIDGAKRKQFKTKGINPQIQSVFEIEDLLEKELYPQVQGKQPEKIFFYGAGCATKKNQDKVVSSLKKKFSNTQYFIDHDLNAAGRALFGTGEGIACILGTGSNSGIYKLHKIITKIPSLGYLIGDEGSGAYISKMFVRDVIYGIAPSNVVNEFYETHSLNKEKLLDKIYLSPGANIYLASLAKFIIKKSSDDYIHRLIRKAIEEFFKYHILPYEDYEKYQLGFVGSIAYYNQSIIRRIASSYDMYIKSFIQNPIDGLIEYHLNLQA